MDRASRPSWRKKGRTPAQPQRRPAAQAATDKPAGGWRSRRTDAAQSTLFYQRLRLLGLSLAALALVVAFVLALIPQGRETPILATRVLNYAAAFPPNSFAEEDLQRLVQIDGLNKNIRLIPVEASREWRTAQYLEYLQQQLDGLERGGPRDDVAIVILSAHGAVDVNNQPGLLLSDAEPLNSETWLPLDRLLDVLRSQQTRPSRRPPKLLLVLDAGRIDDCWSAGLLYNAFAERLREVVQAAAVPGLYVLNAAGPGQVAWSAPELNGTPFGYFLAKGLDGYAAGSDNLITLGELATYVRDQVAEWTLLHRASVQHAWLVPEVTEEDDFPIAYAGRTTAPPKDEKPFREPPEALTLDLNRLAQLWEDYDRLLAAHDLVGQDPLQLADLQHQLLRAEQLLWAGSGYRDDLLAALGRVQARLGETVAAPWPADLAGLSLPLAGQFTPADQAELRQRSELLAAWQAAGGQPKPNEGEPPLPPVNYLAAADVSSRWLAGLPQAGPSQLQEVLDFVASSLPRPDRSRGSSRSATAVPELLEVEFAAMLRRYLDWPLPGDPQQAGLDQAVPLALAARRAAEEAAAPRDQRSWLWVEPLVEAADQRRRELEDLLFAGGADAAAGLKTRYQQLLEESGGEGTYPAAAARAAEISGHYASRDAAWSELPYLAAWLVRQPLRTPLEGQDSTARLEQLQQLIAATRQLSAELDRCLTEQAAEPSAELRSSAERVQQLHTELRNAYLQLGSYLEQAGEDRLTLNRIGDVLRVPLLDARRRISLIRTYARILFTPVEFDQASAAGGVPTAAAVTPAAEGPGPLERYLEALGGWEQHPALALLDRTDLKLLREAVPSAAATTPPGLAWIARQGGLLRQQLSSVPADLYELERVSRERLALADETPANARAGLSQADRLARAAAAFAPAVTGSDLAPVQQLRLVDLHYLLLAHSWRVLEDFWGSSAGRDADPYFARAAEAYLSSARQADNTPRSLRHGRIDLDRLLEARRRAAREVVLQVEDALSLQTDQSVPHQLQVRWPGGRVEPAAAGGGATPASLPAGVAAVYLEIPAAAAGERRLLTIRDETDQRAIRRFPLPASQDAGPQDVAFRLPLAELQSSGAGADLDALCLYRGHRYQQRFRVLWPPWVSSVEVSPQPPSPASITVEGEGQRTGHIMFVFDCSGSMEKGGRMETARQSLRKVLAALLSGAPCEVGLRVYGRRARFTTNSDLSQRDYVAPQYQDVVHPDTDVERLVGLRTLDQRHYDALLAELNGLQHFGQTPLYLALKLAMDEGDFRGAGPDEPQRLVLITDGVNQQIQLVKPTMQEVLETQQAGWRDVQIDIVGLDVEADLRAADRFKVDELKKLAESTGGAYYPVTDSAGLLQALQEALQLVQYSVTGPGANSDGILRRNLGETWPLPEAVSQPTHYDVRLIGIDRAPGALVQIEGGEALLLRYDAARNRLFYPRYEPQRYDRGDDKRGVAQVCEDPSGSGAYYTVQPLLPRRSAGDVAFYVYLQHQDDQTFTRRPKHVRAEIRPVGAESDRVYYFSDPDFLPQRPVPVLRFLAQDWPAAAAEADIRLWAKFDAQAVEPEWRGPVDPLRTLEIKLDGPPEVTFQISGKTREQDAYSVIVTERHPLAGPVQPARVRALPLPDELIRHEYAGKVNVLKHEFRYRRPTAVEIEITSRERLLQGALQTDTMRVKVQD